MATIPGSNPYASSTTGTNSTATQDYNAPAKKTTTDSGTAAATKSLADNFDNFLTLLTTQLKNQDPLKPMDSTEFTTQLVQFTGVEQQINANKSLDKILAQGQSNQSLQAASFIDRAVEAKGNGLTLGTNGDPSDFAFELSAQATTATAAIKDADGNIIRSFSVPVAKGRNIGTWDGKTTSGMTAQPGFYTYSVSARDAKGQPIQAVQKQIGVVTDVAIDDTGTYLNLNGQKVAINDVTRVSKT
jgi:flagellar basal-body rod modification protein FlgD